MSFVVNLRFTLAKLIEIYYSRHPWRREKKMLVNGRDCLIVIKTAYREVGIPYAEETIREAVSLLTEEAAIEGDGSCKAIRKSGQQVGLGVTGCVVTPLTIGTAPLLLYLAMGSMGLPLYVSETRNLYRYKLDLLPAEDSTRFDLDLSGPGLGPVIGCCEHGNEFLGSIKCWEILE